MTHEPKPPYRLRVVAVQNGVQDPPEGWSHVLSWWLLAKAIEMIPVVRFDVFVDAVDLDELITLARHAVPLGSWGEIHDTAPSRSGSR